MSGYEVVWTRGTWRVVRNRDGVEMVNHPSVFTCLRWVSTWGGVDLGR